MKDTKINKGLSIALIVVGVIVALSGVVYLFLMNNIWLGLFLVVIGLVFSYFIYHTLVKKEEVYEEDLTHKVS